MRKDSPPRRRSKCLTSVLAAVALLLAVKATEAAAWLEGGDPVLRSDIELLAAHGLIKNLVTAWPIPRGQLQGLNQETLAAQPRDVQLAAQRVLAAVTRNGASVTGEVGLSSRPTVIRSYGTAARGNADAGMGLEWNGKRADAALRIGASYNASHDDVDAMLDGSYAAGLLGNVRVYAGWVEQWSGPGWTSSLILSNNARPFPKIGLMRDDPRPFATKWLSWLGPWQANLFVGYLDGKRIDRNTAFGSLRLSINPLPGLELVVMRSLEFCGQGHVCKPLDAAFHLRNDNQSANSTNDEATLEFKYTGTSRGVSWSPYFQMMNEDTGPFTHAYTSHLGGFTLAGPWQDRGAHWRFTAEYADSVATVNAFDFSSHYHGIAYGNAGYPDGFRYRGRTLGFSLDSDSRLASAELRLIDHIGRSFSLTAYRAHISTRQLAAIQASGDETALHNVLSAVPLVFSEIDAGLSLPIAAATIKLLVRARNKALPHGLGDRYEAELGCKLRF